MKTNKPLNYCKGIVIVHGKSEYQLVKYITTNLHLPISPFSKKGGENSIQINSIMNFMRSAPFNNKNELLSKYVIEENKKNLIDFKLFMIMDTDDCEPNKKDEYINKDMFKGHWLYDYIIPIYNCPELESVMVKAGILERKLKDHEKNNTYVRIFPLNTGAINAEEILEFKNKVKDIAATNIEIFIDYCLDNCKKIK